MKTTIKLMLVVCLFGSTVLADGNQGVGGRNCGGANQPACSQIQGGGDETGIVEIVKIAIKQILSGRF